MIEYQKDFQICKDKKNSQAYRDCSEYLEPTMPDDEEYMKYYTFWRQVAMFPEDTYEEE